MAARPDDDRPLGIGPDADQRKAVPLSGLMQPLVGTLFQLIDQARSTPVRQFRGLAAASRRRKNPSTKGKRQAEREKSGRRCCAAAQ
ncbi:hypothetical protein LNP26_27930 [Klebsiella variicola subsp. variicola]|nr:hypothetical protein [Klebsiella variicola subsp. variicola]